MSDINDCPHDCICLIAFYIYHHRYAYDKASNIRAVFPQFLTSAMATEILNRGVCTICFIWIQRDFLRTIIFLHLLNVNTFIFVHVNYMLTVIQWRKIGTNIAVPHEP